MANFGAKFVDSYKILEVVNDNLIIDGEGKGQP